MGVHEAVPRNRIRDSVLGDTFTTGQNCQALIVKIVNVGNVGIVLAQGVTRAGTSGVILVWILSSGRNGFLPQLRVESTSMKDIDITVKFHLSGRPGLQTQQVDFRTCTELGHTEHGG